MWVKRVVLALGMLFLAAAGQPARAAETCYDYCTNGCPASYPERGQCTDNCALRCSPGGDLEETHPWAPGPSRSGPAFGAIAYGRESTAAGWAYGQSDASTARAVALKNCATRGGDCKLIVTFKNDCAALAASGLTVGYDEGISQQEAQANALTDCRRRGGGRCEIKAWSCAR